MYAILLSNCKRDAIQNSYSAKVLFSQTYNSFSDNLNLSLSFSVCLSLSLCFETGNRLTLDIALNKREYLIKIWDNLCLFCINSYVLTPHLNRLNKTVQMRGYKMWFQ